MILVMLFHPTGLKFSLEPRAFDLPENATITNRNLEKMNH